MDLEDHPDRLLTREEAAKFLRLPVSRLARWPNRKNNPLPYVKMGRSVRYKLSEVLAFIAAKTK